MQLICNKHSLSGNVPSPDAPRTADVTATDGASFSEFVLPKPLLSSIACKGYRYPSPIQKAVIPLLLEGKSVLARAKNGTGKTAAYAIPILNIVDPLAQQVQAVVLVPTRELAVQTEALFNELGAGLHVFTSCVTGGEAMADDVVCLIANPQIVVGTPGRLLDLITKGVLSLDRLKVMVLDDVDKLVEEGQREAVEPLVQHVCGKSQLAALSATFPAATQSFFDKYMKMAVAVNTMKELTLIGVSQYYDVVPAKGKLQRLYVLIHALKYNQMIIFCNSNKRVMTVSTLLRRFKVPNMYIHSVLPQEERLK